MALQCSRKIIGDADFAHASVGRTERVGRGPSTAPSPGLDGKIQHLKPTDGFGQHEPSRVHVHVEHGTAPPQVRVPPYWHEDRDLSAPQSCGAKAYSGTLCQRKSLSSSMLRIAASRLSVARQSRPALVQASRALCKLPDGAPNHRSRHSRRDAHQTLRAHLFCVTLSPWSPKAVPPLSDAFAFRRSSQASLLRMTI